LDRSLWTELGEATDGTRYGGKASTLARLAGAGLPVLPGFVLAIDDASRATTDPKLLARLVDHLLQELRVGRWILRSSSPFEDLPGGSAAGWFLSTSVAATGEELDAGLRAVMDSARNPRLIELLGQEPPLAILAQEHQRFRTWCTAEFRDGELFFEGWRQVSGSRVRWSAYTHEVLDPVVIEAARVAGSDEALLELGINDDGPWILQLRAAPLRAPDRHATPATGELPVHEGLGPIVHTGDHAREYRADDEHCPTPLSVLLATSFGRWIAADAGNSASRIVDGRWHDPAPVFRPQPAGHREAEAGWLSWRHQLTGRVEPALRVLRQHHEALDDDRLSWGRFLESWLGLQGKYFAMPGRDARAWARTVLAQPDRRPVLDNTPTTKRIRRWAGLREQLLAHGDPPGSSAESIARWVDSHATDPVAEAVGATARRDRLIGPLPYDGFSPGLDEDPWPLYRALAVDFPAPTRSPDTLDTPEEKLASAILSLAESDNELLLESYAIWRSGLRRIATLRGLVSARDLHALDIETFEAWLGAGPGRDFPHDQAARGHALHSAWLVARPRYAGSSEERILHGIAAAGGRASGPALRGSSLLELAAGNGIVAVVDTLGPADAIAVPRFAAIVCATGEVLGHASVLCREFGVPCVVGVDSARQRLARARQLVVDGDRGTVQIVD
jgi:phosphohistidine swiveling domain-containing protein